jgi:hypothetical protein
MPENRGQSWQEFPRTITMDALSQQRTTVRNDVDLGQSGGAPIGTMAELLRAIDAGQ